ncbi:MAG: VWA domain-containing protein [Candidatus Scalindua sp.]|jgi:hypothetical protein|nr:VWA domain-containing protein [Candidatus Scalindua sp.]MBT5303592.1 VWA domain-containing protein [Candidatus Scalindua sp.]MBT6046737.1 VWA domain-containing protein [Candidatus Scalindua sp.]MBT6563015.1 VWA domain-containing protein [Candidatus Scalindua sp.]MBT7211396.1 VWA domain-containing protein [Candidatus Scalindua sp.]
MLKLIKIVLLIVILSLPISVFAANPAAMFVFDGSGSMWLEIDGKPKIELAKKAMEELLKDFPAGVDIGLVAYGHRKIGDCDDIELLAPLGSSQTDITNAVESIVDPRGNTPLAQSIKFAADHLKGRDSSASIIVISDGKESCNADPCAVAESIKATGIDLKIHVVGFDVRDEEAEQLRCIAANGGGKYFAANNASELSKSFAEVKKEVIKEEPKSKIIFRDDFDGESLSKGWNIVNQNEEAMVMEDGLLYLISEPGEWKKESVHNLILYTDTQSLPKKWNIVTKLTTEVLQYPGTSDITSWVGIVLYLDKENCLNIPVTGYCCSDRRRVQFSKYAKGKWLPGYEFKVGGPDKNQLTYFLKVERRSFTYTAYVSKDGADWKKVGSHKALGKNYTPGLYSVRHPEALETTTSFDWFEIESVE